MCICSGVCGAINNDLVYSNATLALMAFNDGACAVVVGQVSNMIVHFVRKAPNLAH